jgi:hypothetical protein
MLDAGVYAATVFICVFGDLDCGVTVGKNYCLTGVYQVL